MSINKQAKFEVIKKYQTASSDTGSCEVQVALLTTRISQLTEHFKIHKKDKHSRLGLIKLINKRRKLLAYVKGKSQERYLKIIGDLGLRK